MVRTEVAINHCIWDGLKAPDPESHKEFNLKPRKSVRFLHDSKMKSKEVAAVAPPR